jgi:hypothetical protein
MAKPDKPLLFDIWEDVPVGGMAWRVQMVGYVAFFSSEDKAKGYVDAMKKVKAQENRRPK